ncbi:uncharacterized protein MONOS_14473 [Monocercomonoides exilis]|uniref:uncharacterized protein n=1 Tax=Monocercomonoides exilis TaxID=2049356 RepID=UPI00355A167B|nr:hypothetical protein MONOS_14473 [Monocercomonoides exilis]|eukprot:MONOS_14473.1-p1 / transcript=MONOS_14473.1 / gene=MONOS_14473 / organism=Monocercomonoides_exilis_PA203 / gene_product=unspecified product / transcript_product=unspecified product / location=Mono_scaffold01008:7462-15567(+) / protein_length=2702 / sequence_SO=supercontig / SO=protein_coding / is_pseudo=false
MSLFNISVFSLSKNFINASESTSSTLMSCCSFSSVCDVYDGGIVPSLNSPSSSLAASNTSFARCYRSQNVAVSGSEGNPSKPARQQIADNEANSFTWCVWNGTKTTGTSGSYSDGTSNGGAIYMYGLSSGTLSVKFCSFNDCYAYWNGGGVMCAYIESVEIVNNTFNSCTTQAWVGGGMCIYPISSCVRISGCEFQKCSAKFDGGGLHLYNFQVSGTGCIGTESGKGESACVFECLFTSCTLSSTGGGGMYCYGVSAAFKMRSIQFISCSALREGGGLDFYPHQSTAPSNNIYCYFFFFHDCRCMVANNPGGHDVEYLDTCNLYLDSGNPFHECYTTNTDDKRVCYRYNYSSSGSWVYQLTEKKDWLKNKTIYIGENGNDSNELCGMNETMPCKTIGYCVNKCYNLISFGISVLNGKYVSEVTTISVGEKKISVVGRGKTVSVIGTSALSTSSPTLFSISTGQLEVGHVGIDRNAARSSSPSVFVVSVESGTLSLEDVVIDSSTSGGSGISSSVFEVTLSQLKMIDVEIENMKISQPLFADPSSAGSSSDESLLGNVTIRNVNRTGGDGVVMAKSVKGGETFVVCNTTIEGCFCESGNGGGIKVELASSTSKAFIGTSTSHSGGTTIFNKTKCSGYGGGVMLYLADSSFDFTISSVSFVGCSATLGGKDVFVNGSRLVSGTITATKLNFSRNVSIYDELMGYDRNEGGMGIFPLNVFLEAFSGAAHVGKGVNGYGGYDSWFCGFGYFPCKTIAKAAENRFSLSKKNIVLDSGFGLGEVVSMAGSYEWEVYCTINKTNVNVRVPSGMTSSYLINVQSSCSMKNIAFQIPFLLSSATSLICLTSSSLTLTDCSVAHSSESTSNVSFGYSFVNAQIGNLKMDRFVIGGALVFGAHSAIEFSEGMTSVICSGCNINAVKRNEGDGGWIKGTVGTSGTLTFDGCNVNGCSCAGGKGGGIYVGLKGSGKVVVNGTSVIDGNNAENNGERGGRGGGMFVLMESEGCGLIIGQNVEFSKVNGNVATYGKDVFVDCGIGVFLESKVNTSSFAFFDESEIPSDVLRLSGSENGNENGVIPLFVNLCSMGTKVIVDVSGGNGKDHNHCGFEKFGCLTVDYCANSRMSSTVNEIEIVSSSSITKEITGPSYDVSISGRIESSSSSDGERMGVNVSDGGSATQDWLVGCSSSLTMRRLSFVVKGQLNSRRSAFIHSTSTLSVTNCSISFESGALTDGKIGYSIIDMAGGNLVVDGFVMESGVTLTVNGKSPITMTSGAQLEISNSRMSGVEVNVAGGNGGGGCLNVGMGVNANVNIEESNLSSTCSGGSGMKGGGMMISAEDGGSLEIKSGTFTGCQVPTEGNLQKGRGMGGGMFVRLADTMGAFVLEGVTFERCNAWKGKKVFISGNDLSEVMSNEQLKWGLSAIDKNSLDELCGWERKTTGEGYVIPLVVYLWTIWSKDGFVSKEKGGDFSGCGFSEAPCSSIDHLISLRYSTLGEGETHISIGDSGLLSHSISFSSSLPTLPDSEAPAVVIKGTKKGSSVTITDEDGNAVSSGAMISSNVSLSFVNVSFTKPSVTTNHAVFIESSGTNTVLSISDCSFGSSSWTVESFAYCVIKVNGGSAAIQSSTLNKINELKGFIAFNPSASQVTIQNVNISSATLTANSLISMIEEESQMNGNENTHLNGNEPVLRVVGCSFVNITNEEIGASVIGVGSFDNAMECTIEDCTMSTCRSDLSTEGGGMKVVLKGEESVLKVNGSTFSMCKCSTVSGRGGGLFIDGADPNVNCADETQIPLLRIKIVNIKFLLNEAFVGNDIFIKCFSIEHQINETLFNLNNQESLGTNNSVCGRDIESEGDIDLIPLITYYYGLQVFVNGTGSDGRRCGAQSNPCKSINCGVDHIQEGVMNAILIDGEGVVSGECEIRDLVVSSFKKTQAIIRLNSKIEKSFEKDCVMELINESSVERCSFQFEDGFESTHSYLMKVKNGSTEIHKCEFYSSATAVGMRLNSSVVSVESGELKISETTFRDINSKVSVLSLCEESDVTIDETRISNIECEGDIVNVGGKAKVEMKEMGVENVTLVLERCVIAMDDTDQEVSVLNCSFGKCANSVDKGSMMQIRRSKEVKVEACLFDGEKEEKEAEAVNEGNKGKEGLCKWNGSLVDIEDSNVEMKETTVMKSKNGGLWMSGGSVKIENSKFENNSPSVEGYPSARRNVICTGNGELNIVSMKGGDGIEKNTSLWILDEGCQLGGIASERGSSYFIPFLEEVKNTTLPTGEMELIILGKLFLPCNLSLKICLKNGNEEEIVRKEIYGEGYISENEVHSVVSSEPLEAMRQKTEVSVCILFGDAGSPLSTDSFILKNKSETEPKGDEIPSKGEKKIEWSLIAFIGCIVIIVILLFVIIVVVVQLRKKQKGGRMRVEDGDIEESKIMGRGEWRKEDVAEKVEEEEMEMQTLLERETGNEMGVSTKKGEELEECENKEMVENSFDCKGVIEVVPVNYIEIQTVASLLGGGEDGNMENGACIGGKEDENVLKSDRKAKRGKRRKGKKWKKVEEVDEIGDERGGCEIGSEELGGVAADDGRSRKPTEYYIGICSAPNSHFSMIGDDSEEQGMKRTMEEEREEEENAKKEIGGALEKRRRVSKETEGEEMMKECEGYEGEVKLTDIDGCLNGEESLKGEREREREGEEKQKRRKKKKKINQKRKDKSEIVRDIAEM